MFIGMQTLKSDQIGFLFQKVAQCSETYEKNNFPIFSFWDMIDFIFKICLERWQKKSKNNNKKMFVPKDVQKINFQIFAIFIFWDIVDFNSKFSVNWKLLNLIQKR